MRSTARTSSPGRWRRRERIAAMTGAELAARRAPLIEAVRRALAAGAAIALALAVNAAAAGAAAVTPSVNGPIGGGVHGRPFTSATFDLGPYGYVEEEYFFTGSAATHSPAPGTTLTADGRWHIVATGGEPYTTRLLVRRPLDASRFNGTVVVEWLNVSGGWDIDADWGQLREEILRSGYAWVGVSAQRAAVNGPPVLAGVSQPLTTWDPERYGTLDIPDDRLSYDIFTHAAQLLGAARPRSPVDPLAGLAVRRLLATGASQSAHRLATYVNAAHPLARRYDGFLIHGRFGRGAALSPDVSPPDALQIRDDLDVPVLMLNTESEALAYFPARQPDTATFRYWEVAGTAHQDAYVEEIIDTEVLRDLGLAVPGCDDPVNDMPFHHVQNAALDQLDRWAAGRRAPRLPSLLRPGTSGAEARAGESSLGRSEASRPSRRALERAAPPSFPPIAISGTPPAIERDAYGNAIGGIRLPELAVPTATYGPVGSPEAVRCDLRGFAIPFSEATLAELYPNHRVYLTRFLLAVHAARDAGFLLPPDARESSRTARAMPIP